MIKNNIFMIITTFVDKNFCWCIFIIDLLVLTFHNKELLLIYLYNRFSGSYISKFFNSFYLCIMNGCKIRKCFSFYSSLNIFVVKYIVRLLPVYIHKIEFFFHPLKIHLREGIKFQKFTWNFYFKWTPCLRTKQIFILNELLKKRKYSYIVPCITVYQHS